MAPSLASPTPDSNQSYSTVNMYVTSTSKSSDPLKLSQRSPWISIVCAPSSKGGIRTQRCGRWRNDHIVPSRIANAPIYGHNAKIYEILE